ncbi:peptidoglycan DD-metalloendopeptidase family protein [Candidatus Peregrinibacteria bacterium]|nr:peptidoglycan DD-metalloendopeptidase family protein [Candidatus Peregrinibacteria bacterium]
MIKKEAQQFGFLATALIALVVVCSGQVFGETPVAGIPLQGDASIFPFASESAPTPDSSKYTESLYEITDQGVKNPTGELIQTPTESTSSPEKPVLPGAGDAVDSLEEYQASIVSNWGGKRAFTQLRLDEIKKNLAEESQQFGALSKKVRHLEKALEPIQRQMESLNGEIDLFNQQISESKAKIKAVEFQIVEKQLTLKDLFYEQRKSQVELSAQQKVVLDYILLVYQEDEKFRNALDNGSSTLKLLLADTSVSENLLGKEYLSVLEETGREVFYDLHRKKLALEEKQANIQKEQAVLEDLNQSLYQERTIMEQNRQTKKALLEETQGKEEQYQQLLEESLKQQLESAIQIQNMRENVDFITEKLKLLDESLAEAKTLTPPDAVPGTSAPTPDATEPPASVAPAEPAPEAPARLHPLSWPVPPNAITAYFHDPTYPSRWGVHQAIDIRAKQFTEIHAPANAYVFQTKDNGMGYSYIILAHKNKLITVYGHVTEILVKAGTVVKEGDVIGLSGATPGTKGAGYQTTGPHLHFEVWRDGSAVNPLDYLPVELLPLEYIPDDYLKQLAPTMPSSK